MRPEPGLQSGGSRSLPGAFRLLTVGAGALALAGVLAASWPASGSRAFVLPGHGALIIDAPADWKVDVLQPPDDLPPTITFSQSTGASFQVLMTPAWTLEPDRPIATGAGLQAAVQRAANEAQKVAENAVVVTRIQGASGPGFVYTAIDPKPKPGEWKDMRQGIVSLGGVNLNFTILTNDHQAVVLQEALSAVRSARLGPVR